MPMVFSFLVSYEWDKSHESRVLDREGEFALVFGARAGLLARRDASVRIQELL
jgi:hypothetical protein